MKRISALHLAAALVLFGAISADAADTIKAQDLTVRVDKLADGLEHPWAVEVLPDGAYLVTERPGRMRIIREGKVSDPIGGVPKVSARGQGGLMDVALAPDFATSRKLYFTAAIANRQGSGTEAFSATLSADEKTLDAVKPVFTMRRFTSGNIQYGSRIAISGDG